MNKLYRIKPLEWEDYGHDCWQANYPGGEFSIQPSEEQFLVRYPCGYDFEVIYFEELFEAKAWCQERALEAITCWLEEVDNG